MTIFLHCKNSYLKLKRTKEKKNLRNRPVDKNGYHRTEYLLIRLRLN